MAGREGAVSAAQHSVLSSSRAFYRAAQRSIALSLFKGPDNENVPVHFVSLLSVFCTPDLIFGGARNLCPPRDGASVSMYCVV